MRFALIFCLLLLASYAQAAPSLKPSEISLLIKHSSDQNGWPNARQQKTIWDSFLQIGTKTIQYTPFYGHTMSENVAEVVSVDIQPSDYPIDWLLLMEFDLLAATAWDQVLTCSEGDSKKAIEQYLTGKVCKDAAEKIRSLKESLLSLGTFQLSALVPNIRNCRSKIQSKDNCRYLQKEIARAQNPIENRRAPLYLLNQIEEKFPKPTLHPFLIQLLFEQLSIDDPTARMVRHSAGLFGRDSFYSIEFPYFHNSYISALDDIIRKGTISEDTHTLSRTMGMPLTNEQDPILFQMRRSTVIANIIMMSHSTPANECANWGLVPALTHRLLEAKRRSSSSHTIVAVERMHEAISKRCGLPIEINHFHFFMTPQEKAQAAMVLGVNDVWKAIANTYFTSPSAEAVLWRSR